MGTPWTDISFPFGSILTSAKQTNLFNNFTAFGEQSSGSPIMYPMQNLISGFNMDYVDPTSPGYTEAMKVGEGWCIDKSRTQGMYLDTDITKEIMSGSNYSFGNSGGAVPSSLSSIWATQNSFDTYFWTHIFLMKNTSTGSMDWGIDTDIDSANNLMIEVNSVNNGGWDCFRRIGNIYIWNADYPEGFVKRDNTVFRNEGLYRPSSITNATSFFTVEKIGPSGIKTLCNVTCTTSRGLQDYIYIGPGGSRPTYTTEFGRYGNVACQNYQSVTILVNSGCLEAAVKPGTAVIDAQYLWNWYIDFLDGVK